MKKIVIAGALVFVLAGCTTMSTARYSVSADNNQALKAYAGSKALLMPLAMETDYNAKCRLVGPIKALDGMTLDQLITKAFNDEFKFADIYSDSGVRLTGAVTKAEFSSTAGLTNGWWDIGVRLDSSNGKSLSVANKYEFKSGFDALTACNHTAQALGPAVQDMIKKAVTDPAFGDLIK